MPAGQKIVMTFCTVQKIPDTFRMVITTFCPVQKVFMTFCPLLVLQPPTAVGVVNLK